MYIAIAEVCKHIHKKQRKSIVLFFVLVQFSECFKNFHEKKMKHSGRPFSEDSDVEVIVLSDSEGGTSAKEEKRNRNKEREVLILICSM